MPLPVTYTSEYIFEHEINPIQFDMIEALKIPASPRWNTSKKVKWFESNGAKFENVVFQSGQLNNNSKMEFSVHKWSSNQIIENYSKVHGVGDTLRQALFRNIDTWLNNDNNNYNNNNNNNTASNSAISIHPQHQNCMMIETCNESKNDYEKRLIIGQPLSITTFLYQPFGDNFKLPIFVKYMRLTQQQMNTLPIKIDDKRFCGDPSNYNDLSHYDRMNDLINFTLDFYHYFVFYEFKTYEQKDHSRNTYKLARELYLYPRIGKLTEGVNVLMGVIKFIPSISKFFNHSKPYFKFVTNYTDRMTIFDRFNNSTRLHIIPRTFYIYHVIQKMHTRGDYQRPPPNAFSNNNNNNNNNNGNRVKENEFHNKNIISINYINKMIDLHKSQKGNQSRGKNGKRFNPSIIFSNEYTQLMSQSTPNSNSNPNHSRNVVRNSQNNSNSQSYSRSGVASNRRNGSWSFNNNHNNPNINDNHHSQMNRGNNNNNNNSNDNHHSHCSTSWNLNNPNNHRDFQTHPNIHTNGNNNFNPFQSQSQDFPFSPNGPSHNSATHFGQSHSNPNQNQHRFSSTNTNDNNNNSNNNKNGYNVSTAHQHNPFGSMFSSNSNNRNVR